LWEFSTNSGLFLIQEKFASKFPPIFFDKYSQFEKKDAGDLNQILELLSTEEFILKLIESVNLNIS
jgi:hypothetical protein